MKNDISMFPRETEIHKIFIKHSNRNAVRLYTSHLQGIPLNNLRHAEYSTQMLINSYFGKIQLFLYYDGYQEFSVAKNELWIVRVRTSVGSTALDN